jgi:hypothetical protein
LDFLVRTRAEWIRELDTFDPALGVILLLAGLIYSLLGWRIFKVLIILNCAALGAALAGHLGLAAGQSGVSMIALALLGALILGSLAFRLIKGGVVLCSALIGGGLGIVLTATVTASQGAQLAGGAVGLLVATSLAFVVFEHVVIAATSVQGALMTVGGAIIAISGQTGVLRHFHEMAIRSGFLVTFCLLAMTIIGVCVQIAGMREGGSPSKTR